MENFRNLHPGIKGAPLFIGLLGWLLSWIGIALTLSTPVFAIGLGVVGGIWFILTKYKAHPISLFIGYGIAYVLNSLGVYLGLFDTHNNLMALSGLLSGAGGYLLSWPLAFLYEAMSTKPTEEKKEA